MPKRRKPLWPVIAIILAAVAVLVTNLVVHWYTQPQPDYTWLEPGLYLGGYVDDPPPNTQAVLNLSLHKDPYKVKHHRWKPIRDASPAPELDWLREQVDFVREQRQAKRTVYIHCFAGVSRGGMVTVAYYMHREGWTRDQALAHVRKRRPQVRPNPAFMELLLEWEQHLAK